MKIYCVHPISGLTYEQVTEYYIRVVRYLQSQGYTVFYPMVGKKELRCEKKYRAKDYRNPVSTNHAIVERDRWMVMQADIVYANFLNAKEISIGSCMELAWAHDHGKHTVLVMGEDNPHQHAFVIEAADIIFDNDEDAEEYLKKLIKGEI
jgi:nucleoside 2-deoxyribosyltransferase